MSQINDYVGMTKHGAQNIAEKRNMIFRLISVDGDPFLAYPEDQRDDRICVELVGGKVTKAIIC